MSANKSWDVERKPPVRPVPQAVEPTRVRSTKPAKRTRTNTQHVQTAPRPRARPTSGEPLKVRRARARKLFYILLGVLGVGIVAGAFYLCWLPGLRVEHVEAVGPNAEDVVALTQQQLLGTHLWLIPRNSLFFIPQADIRKKILEAHPDIVAVSIKDKGLQGLLVTSVPRDSAFLWCGTERHADGETCYDTDVDGLIFAPQGQETSTSSTLLLKVYAPLKGDSAEPIRAHVAQTESLPKALRLAKALRQLGANCAALALRGDEADFYTLSGTRITYVIGREESAAALAASVFPKIQLNDGSVEYVDLRFESKVYLRKQGGVQL